MSDGASTVVRVGAFSLCLDSFERLISLHGPGSLQLPAGQEGESTLEGMATVWAVRQAVLRALATPPRLTGWWDDIEVRGPVAGPYTLVFRGEVARFANSVLRGDINLSVTFIGGRLTACAVLTRSKLPAGGSPDGPSGDHDG